VGIGSGVAVSRKMLGGGEHAVVLQSPDLRRHKATHGRGVLAEGANVDDWIRGIVVDVGHWGKRQVDADGAPLQGGDPSQLVGVRVPRGCADAHIGWERGAAVEPDGGSSLEIRPDQKRKGRTLLQTIEFGSHVQRRPNRNQETANVEGVDPHLHPGERLIIECSVGARNPGDHQLRDLVAQRQGFQECVDVHFRRGRLSGKLRRSGGRRRTAAATAPQNQQRRCEVPELHRALALWGIWGWCVGCAAAAGSGAGRDRVLPGIDVLLNDSLHLIRNRRIGLVTNQTGVDANGVSDVARLRAAGILLRALFSPEHGFQGAADPGALVASSKDSATGLPIYSLYGRTSAPTDEMLQGIDVMVIDLQDAGARYYTYLATSVEVMRAASRHHLPVLLLDRPNPIGGEVQGNVLDPAFASSVGRLAVAMRHGMTLGELARLAAVDLKLEVDLTVIPVAGWRRTQALDETALPFVPPSPNLRSLESLFHYPGTCLFEGTNLSVGRGSEAPFEQLGAPWLDTTNVLSAIRNAGLQGVRFHTVQFTPRKPGDGKYADTLLAGIRLEVTDRSTYDPTATAVRLLSIIRKTQPDRFRWIPAQFDRLAGGPLLRGQIEQGTAPEIIVGRWGDGLEQFRARRKVVLLYPER
jgi:uncharacterized protein YbbC (DUF1343 family)